MMKKGASHQRIGSSFDSFLEEEGIRNEVEAVAAKRVFVHELEQILKKKKIKKDELAERMGTSRSAVDRLLNPNTPSTLKTLSSAAQAVGKHLVVSLS